MARAALKEGAYGTCRDSGPIALVIWRLESVDALALCDALPVNIQK
jgi:hypothetical protein